MTQIPTRTTSSTAAEHVADHTLLNEAFNEQRFWLPAEVWSDAGAGTAATFDTGNPRSWELDPATDSGIVTTLFIPTTWDEGTLTLYTRTAGTTGTAVLDVQVGIFTEGGTTPPGFISAGTSTIAAGSPATELQISGGSPVDLSAVSDRLIALKVVRDADHASDTLTADLDFLGALFTKTG